MGANIKILAVDDSAVNLAAIEQELRDEYEIIAVNSGERALQYLKNETPDLMLLDIQMASMDGLETLGEIRKMKEGNSIPVIMLTAKSDKTTFLESTRLGIYDYIVKPFQADDLHERILRTLKRAGVIEFTPVELEAELTKLQRDLEGDNGKGAVLRAEEISNYKMEMRVKNAIEEIVRKLHENDVKGALDLMKDIL